MEKDVLKREKFVDEESPPADVGLPKESPVDIWQCPKCGEELKCRRGVQPASCPNPNCRNRVHFLAKSGPFQYFAGKKFVPKLLADKIMSRIKFATVKDTDDVFFYNNGCYYRFGEALVKEIAQHELDILCKSSYVNETLDYVRRATYIPREHFERPLEEVCTKNGILNIYTGEFSPHTPDKFFLNIIPVEYNPDAKCPNIEKFFREVLHPGDIPIVEEIFGYCLTRSYPIQKAVMFVGEGANGKSTMLNLLKTFLGKENIASRSLQELEENRFAKADLFGKLANIYPDLPYIPLEHTGIFKGLTGGDVISAEHKFKGSFVFVNYAKLIFSANKVPPARDDTDAFFRRWIILVFPNTFTPDKADPNILQKLTTPEELSGLLNLALRGLRRLLEQGQFSYSKTTEEIREEYIKMSDPVRAFVMDYLEIAPNEWIPKKELYTAFCAYCREKKYPPVGEKTFHERLAKSVRVTDYRPKVEGKRVYAWLGIRFRIAEEEEMSPAPAQQQKTLSEILGMGSLAEVFLKLKRQKEEMEKTNALPAGEEIVRKITQRLLDRFGVEKPFQLGQCEDMFTEEELSRLPEILRLLLERGLAMKTPDGIMLVRR